MSKMIKGVTIVAVAGTLLSGCATPPPPPPPPPPAVVVIPVRPSPPDGAGVGFVLPNKDVVGHYLTPSVNLSREETLWHLRMALNVAALACDPAGPTISLYGQFLTTHAKPLAEANKAEDQIYKSQFGSGAVKARDTHMTETYNFYSLPPVMRSFCPAANEVLVEANATPSASLFDYAPIGLAKLDIAFTNFFGAYEKYLVDVAAWDAKYAPRPSAGALAPTGSTTYGPVIQPIPAPPSPPPSPKP